MSLKQCSKHEILNLRKIYEITVVNNNDGKIIRILNSKKCSVTKFKDNKHFPAIKMDHIPGKKHTEKT